jgi:ketol-acid reductoisomerase
MMKKVYYDEDVSLEPLKDKTVAVIGYGSQGRNQALNMRDSGVNVIIGLRPSGSSWKRAVDEGFEVYSISEASRIADIVHMLIPDLEQPKVFKDQVAPHMTEGKVLGFSHGLNIHFKQIIPPPNIDVIMVAPKVSGA